MERNRSTTLVHLPSPSCHHFCLHPLDLAAERKEISGEEKGKEAKRTERKVGGRVLNKKGLAHQVRIVLLQIQCAPSLGFASVSATSQGSPSAGERGKRFVANNNKEEEREELQVLVPRKQIVLQRTRCALSLVSVNVSVINQEMKSVGEGGRVFVQTVDPQMRKALNKEAMTWNKEAMAWNKEAVGVKTMNRALATLMGIVQQQIPSALNLGFASANATSQEMLSAGVKEIVSVVEKKVERKKEQV